MGNKLGLMLMMAILGMATWACKTRPTAKAYAKAVNDADQVMLYQVQEYPVAPGEQASGQYYVLDYPASGGRQLSADEIAAVKAALLAPSTFDSSAVKSCPMIPKAALELRAHGQPTLKIVLSPAPCGKAMILSPSAKVPQHRELTPGNALEPIVFGKGN